MDATALYKFSSGLYVVSAHTEHHTGACVINTGLQLTSDPLQIQVVVNKENHTQSVIKDAGHFGLTLLDERANMELIGRFGFQSSAEVDKFAGIDYATTELGDPYPLQAACAIISCKVVQTLDVGTHTLFVGEVVGAENLSSEKPLTYAYYHAVLKGKTPPKASSFVPGGEETSGLEAAEEAAAELKTPTPTTKDNSASSSVGFHHFRCLVCGYVVETSDEELPDNFVCPACGAGKEFFEKID